MFSHWTFEPIVVSIVIAPVTVAPLAGEVIFTAAAPLPFWTLTVTLAVPTTVRLELNPFAVIVWLPFETVVESQLNVVGGEEAK